MIEQAFLSLLTTVPAVTMHVNDRVYFGMRPQNERRPSLVLTRTGTSFFRTLKGASKRHKGSLQIDALAPTYQAAKELAKAVHDVLDEFNGNVLNFCIDWIVIDDMSDIPTAPLEGRAEPTYGVSLDVRFMGHEQQ